MSKLSRRSFLGGAATSAAGFLTSVALPSAAHASDETPQKGDQTADLLVIGAGGAGLATAVSAAQHGVKNIIILENGENVNPEELERELSKCSLVKETLVYEEEGKICAEIY